MWWQCQWPVQVVRRPATRRPVKIGLWRFVYLNLVRIINVHRPQLATFSVKACLLLSDKALPAKSVHALVEQLFMHTLAPTQLAVTAWSPTKGTGYKLMSEWRIQDATVFISPVHCPGFASPVRNCIYRLNHPVKVVKNYEFWQRSLFWWTQHIKVKFDFGIRQQLISGVGTSLGLGPGPRLLVSRLIFVGTCALPIMCLSTLCCNSFY